MKIIDYAIVFVIIVLPIILAVNINISSKIKAQNLESYYKNLIDSAISDASEAMKEVENVDSEVDYGYSGEGEKKVSINAEHAVNIFFDSLFYNLDIKGNEQAEERLKMYVPAMAVVDYNGVHMYSIEKYKDQNGKSFVKHIMKPKKYFTYSYDVDIKFDDKLGKTVYKLVPGTSHTVNFTLNNFITHIDKEGNSFKRFMEDTEMQNLLFDNAVEDSTNMVKSNLIAQLKEIQKEVIVRTVSNEVATAINRHNKYAAERGIRYSFTFPTMTEDEWYSTVQDVGILAFVQGMSVGNKYLNHYSYGLSKLSYNQRYFPTTNAKGKEFFGPGSSMTENNLYHKDKICSLYQRTTPVYDPLYFKTKKEAATLGYSPCPVCFYDMLDYYFPAGIDHTKPIDKDMVNGLPGGKYLKVGESKTFTYTGVPINYTIEAGKYQIEAWGAQGGSSLVNPNFKGGYGGYARGEMTVNNSTTLNLYIGSKGVDGSIINEKQVLDGRDVYVDNKYKKGGYNGGGNASGSGGAGGGGSTDIRIGGAELKNRILVAGGGGGNTIYSTSSQLFRDVACGGEAAPATSDIASTNIRVHRKNSIGDSVQGSGFGTDINIVSEATPVEFIGESGCINRHMPNYPNDESGGGGGYYGGAVYHGDDTCISYGGFSFVNSTFFQNTTITKGVKEGNGQITIKRLK